MDFEPETGRSIILHAQSVFNESVWDAKIVYICPDSETIGTVAHYVRRVYCAQCTVYSVQPGCLVVHSTELVGRPVGCVKLW